MAKKGPELIPYEHTLYDILINDIKGKYFQNMMAPHLLFQIPEKNQLNIHYVENGKLSVWFPLLERSGDISLDHFHEYALISEEQFKEYEKNRADVFSYLLVHKESKIFKEHKANLSEQGKIDYFHPNIENLAKIAKDINKTAKFNKNNPKIH
jgi:hypothetical protein